MKQIFVLFALLAVGNCSVWKGGLRVRFDVGIGIGSSFFYEIPRTTSEAIDEHWTIQTAPEGLPVTSVDLYCYSDKVVCTFYDANGDVAGLQIGVPEAALTNNPYDMEKTGFTKWTPAGGNGPSYWTLQQFYNTEENLASLKARKAAGSLMTRANENKIIENGGVWVVGVDKEVVKIVNTTDALDDEGLFTRQACIPWMGRHYYYKMSKSLSCDEPIFPWFGIVESGELIATGFMTFGNLNLGSNARDWFEAPNSAAVKVIVPDGPDCIYDLAGQGLFSMHVYYVDQPWLVSCIFQ